MTDGSKPSQVLAIRNEEDPTEPSHVYYEHSNGEKCLADSNKNYKVRYEIYCGTSEGKPDLNVDLLTDPCAPKVTFSHRVGCPAFQATSIVRYFSNNPWAIGAVLMVFGLIVTMFGAKFFEIVLSSVSGTIVFFALMLLFSTFGAFVALDKGKGSSAGEITAAIVCFVLSIAAAVFVGWFMKKVTRTGIMLAGAAVGFFLGFLAYTFFFINFVPHWGMMIGLSLVGCFIFGWLANKYDKHILVYLTALIGSYCLIRGISIFAGHFPNEVVLYGQISSGTFDGLTW